MLKQAASFVLASFRPSTYPREYASPLHSLRPCWTACFNILRLIPPVASDVYTSELLARHHSFSAAGWSNHPTETYNRSHAPRR